MRGEREGKERVKRVSSLFFFYCCKKSVFSNSEAVKLFFFAIFLLPLVLAMSLTTWNGKKRGQGGKRGGREQGKDGKREGMERGKGKKEGKE